MQAELHGEPFDHAPQRPGSDEAPYDDHDGAPADDEGDVLEETPDFLAEAPEHDRMWFEQRPPRDFDFDK
jgi:hypothetical protein